MTRAPCVRCGEILHTGEAKEFVGCTVAELVELAYATGNMAVKRRFACAVGLLDEEQADQLRSYIDGLTQEKTRAEIERERMASDDHDFAGEGTDCDICGEGRCHYLHVQWCDACCQRSTECECEDAR